MEKTNRVSFGSKLGFLAAAVGSAVGLGNIWRFPYELGQNGGFAFLIVYLFCAFLIGWPLMLSEFAVGRMGQSNVAGTFIKITGTRRWSWIGVMGAVCVLLVIGFYAVVCGWSLEYIYQAISNQFSGQTPQGLSESFTIFTTGTWRPILWLVIFLIINCAIVVGGVQEGIEKTSKVLMPFLFTIIVVLCIRSITLPGGLEGLKFLFTPDFSKITPSVILSAMGQAFFSLSLGMGCMLTYGSYMRKENNLGKTAFQVVGMDSLISVLCAMTIFPAVFALGIDPSKGPELVFITLPNVFNHIPGGYFWGILFFILLAIAALTSTISMLEVITAYVSEQWNINRKATAIGTTLVIMLLAIGCSLSLGVWSDFTILGFNLFDFFDNFTAKILMPIGGVAISIFFGWVVDRKSREAELTNGGVLQLKYLKLYTFLLKYIVPLAILAVFIDQLLR